MRFRKACMFMIASPPSAPSGYHSQNLALRMERTVGVEKLFSFRANGH